MKRRWLAGFTGAVMGAAALFTGAATASAAPLDPVTFDDAALKSCVADKLRVPATSTITEAQISDMTGTLMCIGRGITDVTPLQFAANLTTVYLQQNEITDVSALAGLHSAQTLTLGSNQISDLSGLESLSALRLFEVNNNQVSDVSPLAGITSLQQLSFIDNEVSNISPLSGLSNLQSLSFAYNRVTDLRPALSLLPHTKITANGQSVSFTVLRNAVNALPAVDVSGALLPLSITEGTGTVSSTSITWTALGASAAEWSWTNGNGSEFSGLASFEVTGVVFEEETLADAEVGESYSHQLSLVGSPELPTVEVTAGELPPGLSLSTDGELSGTPSASGSYTFEITASNSAEVVSRSFVFVVTGAVPPVDPTGTETPGKVPVTGTLPVTGAESTLPFAAAAAALLVLGAAALLFARRGTRGFSQQ